MNNKQRHIVDNIIRKRIKPEDRFMRERFILARKIVKEIEDQGISYCAEIKNKIDEALDKKV